MKERSRPAQHPLFSRPNLLMQLSSVHRVERAIAPVTIVRTSSEYSVQGAKQNCQEVENSAAGFARGIANGTPPPGRIIALKSALD